MALTDCINYAKARTSEAKSIKAYALRAADRRLQQVDMPRGYLVATQDEVNHILASVGKRPHIGMANDGRKHLWCLNAQRDYAMKIYNLNISFVK